MRLSLPRDTFEPSCTARHGLQFPCHFALLVVIDNLDFVSVSFETCTFVCYGTASEEVREIPRFARSCKVSGMQSAQMTVREEKGAQSSLGSAKVRKNPLDFLGISAHKRPRESAHPQNSPTEVKL